MSTLNVRVSSTTKNGEQYWQGTVNFPGIRSTKLVKSSDGTSQFATRSAVNSAARSLAKKLNLEVVFDEPQTTRKAAKRSV